ncbi:MAG: hypothetical protein SA378_08645 [Sedimentibacter sp.]|uniref:hypothetical protein n=1 Tax=Sedimentibacter sp. TaxID=1960295 RepID=UPI002980E24F|nr:hypothetical protein [Sedimentibacter sp.]MDW5300189.1 hypothetical protein [Sedimentibacter sp.]
MNPNKIRLREMQKKKWWNYAMLAAGIFLFTHACSILSTNIQFAAPVLIFSLFMHSSSMKDLGQRLLKTEPVKISNIAMLLSLVIIAVICYFSKLSLLNIFMLNLAAIAIYIILSAICFKLFNKN